MKKSFFTVALLCGALLAVSYAQEDGRASKKAHASDKHEMSAGDMATEMSKMNGMMVKALGKGDADYEKRFIDLMIPHHEGAVLMAKDALKKSSKPELKKMAEKMIEDQEKEIAMLKAHRAHWYGKE